MSEGLEISITCEGEKLILLKTFLFSGYVSVHENPFHSACLNECFIYKACFIILTLKHGLLLINDEQTLAYATLKGFMKVLSRGFNL